MCPTLKLKSIMAIGKDFLKMFSEGLRDPMKLDILSGLAQGASSVIGSIPQTAFGFGTSYLKGIMGHYFNRKSLDYQAQLNEQSAVNAYNRQLDFWNKQNAYNDPSSQMRRLQQAGLNPAMINANGVNNVAGGLSSVPSASPGSPDHSKPDPMSDAEAVFGFAKTIKDMGFLDEQTKTEVEKRLNLIVERGLKEVDKELKIEERDLARLNKIETFEALYGTSLDGGEPTIPNNRVAVSLNEARGRANLLEAEKTYQEAQTSYVSALEQFEANRDSREAMLAVEDAALKKAEASAQRASATYYATQSQLAKNKDARDAEAHAVQQEINGYLKDIKASEAEVAKVQAFIADLWSMPRSELEKKYKLLPGQKNIALIKSFIHDNVRLGGNASWKTKD